jgi:hypothetical protein
VVYILGVGDFVRHDPDDNVLLDTRNHPLTRRGVRGVGRRLDSTLFRECRSQQVRNITVELKHPS